ncbi:isocitrate lyase/phosphoenolpyruvate mutase family protein [Microbispora sp. H11081]|uniref:isocitrate lyase/PEP mutase family protein n=1 Tax=Microbispora sp. H11081 TaxID=2729107 RepID=UPI001472C862|nr:isocitrate lyase/phosphoenolpyruvate mutase family protein [Microbispora sp. H11081]
MAEIHEKAALLRALHVPGEPVVLPNAWDAASACAVEAAGFPAVATGSQSVAASLGYQDGQDTPVDEMMAAVARMTRVVAVPVTADVERGYGLKPAELVERLAAAGAAGCNLEDSDPATGELVDPGEQADFLAAVRAAAAEAGTGLVINARVDTFIHGSGTPAERLAEAIERSRRYLAAGADCVYPILAGDPEAIGALVRETGGPVNVLARPGAPAVRDLAALGVARVSFGPGVHRITQAFTARVLDAIARGDDPFETA